MSITIYVNDESLRSWCDENPTLVEAAIAIGRQAFEESPTAMAIADSVNLRVAVDHQAQTTTLVRVLQNAVEQIANRWHEDSNNAAPYHDVLELVAGQLSKLAEQQDTLGLVNNMVTQLAAVTNQQRIIDTLLAERKSAAVRGTAGENHVLELAKRQWPEAEFIDKSGEAAASDLHVVCLGRRLVIEVKNKAIVTVADVKKAERDIVDLATQHADFGCYIFVSLRSMAIPGKGSLACEINIASGRPIFVVWAGAEGFDDPVLKTALVLADTVSKVHLEGPEDLSAELLSKLKPHFERLIEQRLFIDEMKVGFQAAHNAWKKLAQSSADAFVAFEAEVIPLLKKLEDAQLKCKKCNKVYQSAKWYDAHVIKCVA